MSPQKPLILSAPLDPNRDLFLPDALDAAIKDEIESLEHPIFALAAGDTKTYRYENNGVSVRISPSSIGRATIHDKDIWKFCVSAIVAMTQSGVDVSFGQSLVFNAKDFFAFTNRPKGGRQYKALKDILTRLHETKIMTNIKTERHERTRPFPLLYDFDINYTDDTETKITTVMVKLPDWLWRALGKAHILTLSSDYFSIRRPLDRRIYEVSRKHLGQQKKWAINLPLLRKKCDSKSSLKRFRQRIRELEKGRGLPDVQIKFDAEKDQVYFMQIGQILPPPKPQAIKIRKATPARKAPARKAPARKAPARKAPARNPPAIEVGRAYIEKNAKPGETWGEAKQRLEFEAHQQAFEF